MANIGRNDPCLCGSGKKYKKCCANIENPAQNSNLNVNQKMDSLKPAIRMKGGVTFSPGLDGYIAIVHSWNNRECIGAPQEWRDSMVFQTEDEAMKHYKMRIRPKLEDLMRKVQKDGTATSVSHNKIEQ